MESFENKFGRGDGRAAETGKKETGKIKTALNSASKFVRVAAASFAMSTGALSAGENPDNAGDKGEAPGISPQSQSYVEGHKNTEGPDFIEGSSKKAECQIGVGAMERLDELHIQHEEFVSEEDGKKKLSISATVISENLRENEPTKAFNIELDMEDDGEDGIWSAIDTVGDKGLVVSLASKEGNYEIEFEKTDRLDGAVTVKIKQISYLPTDSFMSSNGEAEPRVGSDD